MTFDRRLTFALTAATASGATALAAIMAIDWPRPLLWGMTSVGLLGCIYLLARWVATPLSRFTGRVAGAAPADPEEIVPRLEAAFADLSEPTGDPRFNAACLAWLEYQLAGCVEGTVALADGVQQAAGDRSGTPQAGELLQRVDAVLAHLRRISQVFGPLRAAAPPRERTVDVGTVIERISHRYADTLSRGHLSLTACTAPSAERVTADEDALSLILDALVANAVRHTPDGGRIAIDAEQSGAHGELIVHVTDTGDPAAPGGAGIPYRPDTGGEAPERLCSAEGAAVDFAARLTCRMGGTLLSGPGGEGGNRFTLRLPLHTGRPIPV